MKRKRKYSRGLKSPAVVVSSLATTPSGQRALDSAVRGVGKGFSVMGKVVLYGGAIGLGIIAYNILKSNFTKMKINSNYPPANISPSMAQAKADLLYDSMKGIGADFSRVKQLLTGLNFNGFVLVYNAFGSREGNEIKNPFKYLNPFMKKNGLTLTQWLNNQFTSENRRAELRAILPYGVF